MRPLARDSNHLGEETPKNKSTAALQWILVDQRLWKHTQKEKQAEVRVNKLTGAKHVSKQSLK